MTSDDFQWIWNGPLAQLKCGALYANVDVSRPQLGVSKLRFGSTALAGELLSTAWIAGDSKLKPQSAEQQTAWPLSLADVYVRGHDLVATYERSSQWPFTPQIYWRIEPVAPCSLLPPPCSISLLVSVQTDLLDTHPEIRVTTRLLADELIRVNPDAVNSGSSCEPAIRNSQTAALPACVLWRLTDCDLSYAEIVPESDFNRLTINRDADGLASAQWELFAEFLEKGVIRRARIQGVFLSRESDEAQATELCRSLASRPLPLTT